MPELLACPDCAGPLKNEGGFLRCTCATYPVVGDIPLLTAWARNRSIGVEEALARFRPPSRSLVEKVLRRLLPGTGPIHQAISNREATFLDLAAALGRTGDLDYFRYRFSDLSFITSAALLTPLSRGPVLDLGCGAGHLVQAIFRRVPRSLVVGLDVNFALLYLAKRFVAPGALYVCADASLRLPFLDGAFESALCADAFKYLPDRTGAARELLRVARGPIVVAHFYDPSFHGEGAPAPLEPDACMNLFSSRSPRLYREEDVLETFLRRRELDLRQPGASRDDVASLTAGVEPRLYAGADYFVSGSQINPIYEIRQEGDRLHLRRRFLSDRHSRAFQKLDGFLPETLTVTREQISGQDPDLVRSFVLLDLPPHYC
jgi:SAM-dependent methyltransferase